jgi:hypothetical protein
MAYKDVGSGFVYVWRDRKHKRYYVGCHWGSPDDGYVCSSTWMMQANHRRPQDFKRRVVATRFSRQELLNEEYRWLMMIKQEELRSRYYNLKIMRDNQWHSTGLRETVGQKISKALKGKPDSRKDVVGTGRKISAAKKGKAFTDEHRAALSEAQKGSRQSEETRLKRAEALRRAWAEGRRKPASDWKEESSGGRTYK